MPKKAKKTAMQRWAPGVSSLQWERYLTNLFLRTWVPHSANCSFFFYPPCVAHASYHGLRAPPAHMGSVSLGQPEDALPLVTNLRPLPPPAAHATCSTQRSAELPHVAARDDNRWPLPLLLRIIQTRTFIPSGCICLRATSDDKSGVNVGRGWGDLALDGSALKVVWRLVSKSWYGPAKHTVWREKSTSRVHLYTLNYSVYKSDSHRTNLWLRWKKIFLGLQCWWGPIRVAHLMRPLVQTTPFLWAERGTLFRRYEFWAM